MKCTEILKLCPRNWRISIVVLVALMQSATLVASEPAYSFRLVTSQNADLCKHMDSVLNSKFKNMWDAPALGPDNDPSYSSTSKYAFPRAAGVAHDSKVVFALRFSRWPASPEFDAIAWKEARVWNGDSGAQQYRQPILVAHIDLDNDGQKDTVFKLGSTRGYAWMASSKTDTPISESLLVWRSRNTQISEKTTMWELWNSAPLSKGPTVVEGAIIRPFIYNSRIYLLRYDLDVGEGKKLVSKFPYLPKESTSIFKFHFSDDLHRETGRPKPVLNAVCRYTMTQVQK